MNITPEQAMQLWRAALVISGIPATLAMDAGTKYVQPVALGHVAASLREALAIVENVQRELDR
jgi:hypothetical protein